MHANALRTYITNMPCNQTTSTGTFMTLLKCISDLVRQSAKLSTWCLQCADPVHVEPTLHDGLGAHLLEAPAEMLWVAAGAALR